MHKTPKQNLEFKITWLETNIRYLLGDDPIKTELLEKNKTWLEEAKLELEKITNG